MLRVSYKLAEYQMELTLRYMHDTDGDPSDDIVQQIFSDIILGQPLDDWNKTNNGR